MIDSTMPHTEAEPVPGDRPGDAAAWRAVLRRDARRDGTLYYGVRTTGVYCKPSCASRRPLRVNVTFYATPQEAEAAGFRECKRCRPRSGGSSAAELAVSRARAHIDAHRDRRVSLTELAMLVGMSPHHLQRVFKRAVGVSPKSYGDARRMEQFKSQLRSGASVTRATYAAGFGSSASVYSRTGTGIGMTPAEYRQGGSGVQIRFATAPTALGRVLVAATARGVCAVIMAGSEAAMEAALREEFPRAERVRVPAGDPQLRAWVGAVVQHLAGKQTTVDVPLDLAGTPFQHRVWQALREIPYGQTRSYGGVAERIGAPGAARAVARACATNPVALVIPCHRVVTAGGAAGGYRWGKKRKLQLLAQEHAIVARAV